MILAIRTDKPEAELYLMNNEKEIATLKWQAHRELADTILLNIDKILKQSKTKMNNLKGLIVFTGEGSFTGLRIGTTVANAIAYSNNIPVVATTGNNWIKTGLKNIKNSRPGELVVPSYHTGPNITQSKKLSLEERPK